MRTGRGGGGGKSKQNWYECDHISSPGLEKSCTIGPYPQFIARQNWSQRRDVTRKKKLLYIACIARPDTKNLCRMKYWIRAIALKYRLTRKKKKKFAAKKD